MIDLQRDIFLEFCVHKIKGKNKEWTVLALISLKKCGFLSKHVRFYSRFNQEWYIRDDNELTRCEFALEFEPSWAILFWWRNSFWLKYCSQNLWSLSTTNIVNNSPDNNGLVQCLRVCRIWLKTNPVWTDKYFSVCFCW